MFHVTIESYECALEFRDGRLTRVLEPGRYGRPWRARHRRFDVRERISSVAPQEIPTADGVSIKVSAAMRWSIVDVVAYASVVQAESHIYLAGQVALRESLSEIEVADVAGSARRELAQTVTDAAREVGLGLGVQVADVVIKDIVLPAEIRAADAELVTARRKGQVQLETARAEAAALRSLANSARLMEDHPALARLRLVQAAPYGTQVVLQIPSAPVDTD